MRNENTVGEVASYGRMVLNIRREMFLFSQATRLFLKSMNQGGIEWGGWLCLTFIKSFISNIIRWLD